MADCTNIHMSGNTIQSYREASENLAWSANLRAWRCRVRDHSINQLSERESVDSGDEGDSMLEQSPFKL